MDDNFENTDTIHPNGEPEVRPALAYFLESKNECMLNPLCYEADDDDLGKRFPGGFALDITDEGHPCSLITYDNGDQYLYDKDENMLYRLGKLEQKFLIHKYLEKLIYDCANHHSIPIRTPFYCVTNEIDAVSFIRLLINQDEKIVYITNILIPFEKKHQNIGKDLISVIYQVCHKPDFRLILLDVVESFKERLRRRNAIVDDYEDSVEITDDTDLKSRY